MSTSYADAADEFKNDRDEELWWRCLTECEMNKKKAQSMYIQLAAKRNEELDRKYEVENQAKAEEDEKLSRLKAIKDRQNKSDYSKNKIKYFCFHWLFGLLISSVLVYCFFTSELLSNADGFFSHLWRYAFGVIVQLLGAVLGFCVFVCLSKIFIDNYCLFNSGVCETADAFSEFIVVISLLFGLMYFLYYLIFSG